MTATFGYADPPYLGLGSYYDHPESHIWDEPETHGRLLAAMDDWFDGWAYSLSSPSLAELLPLAPADVRVCAWVKPFASWKPGQHPAYAWEPVLVRTSRPWHRGEDTARDWVSVNMSTRKGLTGAKPDGFYLWLLDVWQWQPDDRVVDLFPGTGGFESVVRRRVADSFVQLELGGH